MVHYQTDKPTGVRVQQLPQECVGGVAVVKTMIELFGSYQDFLMTSRKKYESKKTVFSWFSLSPRSSASSLRFTLHMDFDSYKKQLC